VKQEEDGLSKDGDGGTLEGEVNGGAEGEV